MRSKEFVSRIGRGEEGQVLPMFGLFLVVLCGFLALVVDLGVVYSERRHLQNVADQAALVGAQSFPNTAAAEADAYANAAANGLTSEFVTVNIPPASGHYAGVNGYIEVLVQRESGPFFAGVIGQGPTTVRARAVAKHVTGIGYGAIIALQNKKSPPTLKISGNSDVYIDGGVWSNGELKVESAASTRVVTGGGVAAVWGVSGPSCAIKDGAGGCVDPWTNEDDPPPAVMADPLAGLEPPTCSSAGSYTDTSGWRIYRPGNYSVIRPNRDAKFLPGVYCVSGDVDLKDVAVGVPTAETVIDKNNLNGYTGTWGPVSFYLTGNNSNFIVNSTAKVRFEASKEVYENVLVWNASKKGGITVNGGSNVGLIGTLYAPTGDITLNGGTNVELVKGQVIGYTIEIVGNAPVNIIYKASAVSEWQPPRLVE